MVPPDKPNAPAILSEDNLLTAARAVISHFNADGASGMISRGTELAMSRLQRHVEHQTKQAWDQFKEEQKLKG